MDIKTTWRANNEAYRIKNQEMIGLKVLQTIGLNQFYTKIDLNMSDEMLNEIPLLTQTSN
ncbi:hypothetical protein [Rickettsiella endosymbiont of Dermanyssus gallinae]|uniref:hypothetical protein n=1 Tax=Rickettsiella endosymbiont of Dermanyssus gallinae TaxID=2856608 RepID=UPI001C532005|nr:hypothetical protein [Rickettsiella endosymbiont of Dermanyssus gallinae]